jgi:galactokinase
MSTTTAFAPGRVNLIGDHTDYAGGLACPIAVDLGTTVTVERGGDDVRLVSDQQPLPAVVPLDVADPAVVRPKWARYVAGVVCATRPPIGATGTIASTVPVGAGLSSSAALELSVALALGFSGTPLELALAAQRAEHAAVGVPCGLLDQLASASGREGHAMVVDFASLDVTYVPLPPDCEVVVVHTGVARELAGSAYAERRAACERAAAEAGPLATATVDDVARIADDVLRRRARHVVTESARVRAFAAALSSGDLATAGRLMTESHASLAADYEVTTEALDALAARLGSVPGVFGARMTGAGFGGCVVALARPGALGEGWRVRAVGGARMLE